MKNMKEIEDIITKAIKKVNGNKENDLCRYIPGSTGGYLHHFTLKKMKLRQPTELCSLLEKFIINSEKPTRIPPKQRAARGSRKKKDQYTFSRSQLEKMIHLARATGNKEIITMLAPKKSLASCKRELIASIRQGKADQDLWNSYMEIVLASDSSNETSSLGSPALANR
ncbi:MAG: hypothetical protein FJZ58_04215 [Chlamydiae bacterium]|nr:hypothetical protein [Chlamydiota bacterium]